MAVMTLDIDGSPHRVDLEPEMPLLYALRDELGFNNPRFGCGLAQCGSCTNGWILCAVALLEREPNPSDEAIRQAFTGLKCRCGGRWLRRQGRCGGRSRRRSSTPISRSVRTVRSPPSSARWTWGRAWTCQSSRSSLTNWTFLWSA